MAILPTAISQSPDRSRGTAAARLAALAIVLVLSAAMGEMTGYVTGYGGQAVLQEGPLRRRIERSMRKAGAPVIFILAAVANPAFDIGGIIVGMLRMPFWRFFLVAWLGKSLRFVLPASLGGLAL